MRKRILGAALATSFALATLMAVAQPVAAAKILVDCTGTCGSYELRDDPNVQRGANCIYRTGGVGYLDQISVRPPLMHGNYSNKTKVDWRFKIRHSASGGAGTFTKVFTSSYQGALANDAIPAYAGNGFSRRTWNAPAHPTGAYQVVVELRWWHQGSVEGTVRALYESYKMKRQGYPSNVVPDYCIQNW